MTELLTPITIGLWAWLFTETLSKEGHIFSFVGEWVESKADKETGLVALSGIAAMKYKWATCCICHAGALAFAIAAIVAALNTLVWVLMFMFKDGVGLSEYLALREPFLFTSLFAYPVIAMTVAKVMSVKY